MSKSILADREIAVGMVGRFHCLRSIGALPNANNSGSELDAAGIGILGLDCLVCSIIFLRMPGGDLL